MTWFTFVGMVILSGCILRVICIYRVFQITRPNSTETADYGSYDTTTVEKVVKAVVSTNTSARSACAARSSSGRAGSPK